MIVRLASCLLAAAGVLVIAAPAAAQAQVAATGETCKSCHDAFGNR